MARDRRPGLARVEGLEVPRQSPSAALFGAESTVPVATPGHTVRRDATVLARGRPPQGLRGPAFFIRPIQGGRLGDRETRRPGDKETGRQDVRYPIVHTSGRLIMATIIERISSYSV
jgi:hypothetical protein